MGIRLYRKTKEVAKKIIPKKVLKTINWHRKCKKISRLYRLRKDNITTVLNMLEDDYSKNTLKAYIELITKGYPSKLLKLTRPPEKQYFDEQVFVLSSGGGSVYRHGRYGRGHLNTICAIG